MPSRSLKPAQQDRSRQTEARLLQAAEEILAERGVKLYIHPSHNVPGDTTAHERLDAALAEYKRRIAGV